MQEQNEPTRAVEKVARLLEHELLYRDVKYIASRTHLTEKTVRKVIKDLYENGYLLKLRVNKTARYLLIKGFYEQEV